MLNLKTANIHTLKAHLDRLQTVAEGLAELAAGETLDGRPESAGDLNAGVSILLRCKQDLKTRFDRVRETPEDQTGSNVLLTGGITVTGTIRR